ncbi:MAG: MBL fold metallo-hydrolase [Phycisphaerales bacterium]|nr:MBL fold metallo-hydrolase [Phycisphaerales bacterium]
MPDQPILEMLPLGDFQANAFLVRHQDDPEACWIVDCGPAPAPLIQAIKRHGVRPAGIVLTHCHHDHIGGIDQVLSEFGSLPIAAHVLEKDWNTEPMLNLSQFLGVPQTATPPGQLLEEDDPCPLGTDWRMLHLPGHSPGSLGFLHQPSGTLIAGDTLFAGSIGRIDFPTSDPEAMRGSLARLLELPDDVQVFPGHGEPTTIGRERVGNPFLRGGTPAI